MKRREVTDEMITRYVTAAEYAMPNDPRCRQQVRQGLNAALNPPPEPEIAVTEEMLSDVRSKINAWLNMSPDSTSSDELTAFIYRAMRRLEPSAPEYGTGSVATPEYQAEQQKKTAELRADLDRQTGFASAPLVFPPGVHTHRRKDDPL